MLITSVFKILKDSSTRLDRTESGMVDRASMLPEPRKIKGICSLTAIFFTSILVPPAVLQNMIGSACNLRIPQANLHATLSFCTYKELQLLYWSYLKHLLVSTEPVDLSDMI